MHRILLAASLLAGSQLSAMPTWAQNSDIMIDNAWARATAAGQSVGGVFLTLRDHGGADRMLSASSPMAEKVQLHETVNDAGVMRMQPVPTLKLAAGQTVELKPGSYHLMLMGLKQKLEPGTSFPVTLTFEKSPPVTSIVTVGAAGASGPPMSHGPMKMP